MTELHTEETYHEMADWLLNLAVQVIEHAVPGSGIALRIREFREANPWPSVMSNEEEPPPAQ